MEIEVYLIFYLIPVPRASCQAIADYVPVGTGVCLRSDVTGFFLGDVGWDEAKLVNRRGKAFGIVTW